MASAFFSLFSSGSNSTSVPQSDTQTSQEIGQKSEEESVNQIGEESAEDSGRSPKRKRTTKGVKEFFDRSTEHERFVVCKLCPPGEELARVKLWSGGFLQPLRDHLKEYHRSDRRENRLDILVSEKAWDELFDLQSQVLGDSVADTKNLPDVGCEFFHIGENIVKVDDIAPDAERIKHYGCYVKALTKAVSISTIVSMFPLLGNFPAPSPNTLVRWVVLFSDLFLISTRKRLENVPLTLTIDGWSTPLGGEIVGGCVISIFFFLLFSTLSFLFFCTTNLYITFFQFIGELVVITAHSIGPDGTPRMDIIDILELPRTAASDIATSVLSLIAQWNLKVIAIITDSASCMIKAFASCPYERISCGCHILNLVINGSLQLCTSLKEFTVRVNSISKFIRQHRGPRAFFFWYYRSKMLFLNHFFSKQSLPRDFFLGLL